MSSIDAAKLADEKYIYLTTIGRKTGNPHTVELWFSIAKEKIYLSHEGKHTDWMKNISKNNRVEFRIRNIRFKGRAQIFRDGEAFEIGKHALYIKYYGKASEDIIDDWFSESAVIEISLIES
jgi:deazaflavin-dependent oxidoreductase (nitroreductase family)